MPKLFRIAGLLVAVMLNVGLARAAENWFEQGLAELKQGHYQRAVDAFSIAIETVPHDFEALNNRGFARIYTGDYDGAIADCTKAIRFNPGSAKAYNNRGFAYIFKESYEAAIADFDRALAINPRYVDAYSNRCLTWIRREHYDRAVADCSQALAINPRSAKSLYNRGFARDRQGDPAGALGDYLQALTVNPDYIEVYNNIAWILATSPERRLRDGRRAVALAEKAVAHTPDVNFMDTLAAAYAEAGRYDEAVAMENRVISMLAAKGDAGKLGPHVERLSLFEEKRPYRDPVKIQPPSAVTDLDRQFETLDRLMQPAERPDVADLPRKNEAPRAENQKPSQATEQPPQFLPADAGNAGREITVTDQTVFTTAGEPINITLQADSADRLPISFDITTVPYQGALSGTVPHLIYTPRSGFTGTDRFSFRAANAASQSRLATVVINVGVRPEEKSPDAGVPPTENTAPDTTSPDLPPPPEAEPMPTPSVSLPAEPVPGTAAMKPAETAPASATTTDPPAPVRATRPATTSPQPRAKLPEGLIPGSNYTIQVRSYPEAEDAAQEVAQMQRNGFVAFSHPVEIPGKGVWYRVYINVYPTLETARQGLADLDAARFKDALIRRIPEALRPAAMSPAAVAPPQPATSAAAGQVVPALQEEHLPTYPYAYRIKSYREKNDAFQLGVELTSMGRKALIGGTTVNGYRVYVGCFRTPEEAEKTHDDLTADGFEEAVITMIPYAIVIRPPDHDPRGETIENQLLAGGFLPYRRPGNDDRDVLVGGFQIPEEAEATIAALESSGYDARVVKR
ncbi:MAG: tetratricopeptide repeat protein [Desulfobacterales bacterium]|jgi:tetratricopeptide (TPR) repeat protein/cell division protein FtsN